MDLFVARQPIFDAHRSVVGYELLYRRSAEAPGADGGNATRMSSDVIVQYFLEAGIERLTGGLHGYVNFTREMLVGRTYELFDPDSIVVEVVEDVVADREVIAACRELRSSGYTLALDDFVVGGVQEPLLEHANIVKVDLLNRPPSWIEGVAAHLRPFFGRLLAERVETAEVAAVARGEGFSLFQGYYFSRPETIGHRASAVESLRLLPVLNLVHSEDTSQREVERAFRSDPTLSYKLLQIAQSATNGSFGVKSIRHAIQLVGRRTLYRWLSLVLASSLASSGVHRVELLEATLLRARFLESLATRAREDGGPLFLVGLFSNMDSLLGIPLRELLTRVRLTEDVQGALLRHRWSPYLPWLELAEAYEVGQWERVADLAGEIGIPAGTIPALYLRALQWAGETLTLVTQAPPEEEQVLSIHGTQHAVPAAMHGA